MQRLGLCSPFRKKRIITHAYNRWLIGKHRYVGKSCSIEKTFFLATFGPYGEPHRPFFPHHHHFALSKRQVPLASPVLVSSSWMCKRRWFAEYNIEPLFEGDIVKMLGRQLGGGAYAAKSPPARPPWWDLPQQAKACAVTQLLVCWQQRLFANSLSRGGTQLPCVHAYITNFLGSYI
jgi:hypothetical protein